MSGFQVGYASVNVNPTLGIGVFGYYVPRFASGYLDDLEASALALQLEDKQVVLISIDHCGLDKESCTAFRNHICEKTGVSVDHIFISSTHTHTGPQLIFGSADPLEQKYI